MKQITAIILIIVLFFTVFLATGIYLPLDEDSAKEAEFLIKKGEGAKEISLNLKEKELIRWSSPFRLYVLLKGVGGELKAGRYLLSKSENVPEMVDKFFSGDVVKEEITVIEGWNLRDIGFYFENKGMFMAEEFFEKAGFPAVDYSRAADLPEPLAFDYELLREKPDRVGLEGFLFPDTYEIYPDASLEEIIQKMLDNFEKKISLELREEIGKEGKTVFDVVTMASLIEKEVQSLEDKKLVSGILWKRMENNVPLQVDATITYVTGKKSVNVSKKETEIDSPFNSYKYRGLPLGPICNPGLESIEAALYPKESSFWYYLSTPKGETVFSRSLLEHNRAKAEYLK